MTTDGLALVLAGGDPPPRRQLPETPRLVVAADSGLHHADGLGVRVDLVVGDLDSVDPARLADAEAAGTLVDRHPAAKDKTDLELALDHVLARGHGRVLVVGIGGGRADHALANLLLLASDDYAALALDAWLDGAVVSVVRGRRRFHWEPGDTVTLLSLGGHAHDVHTSGLEYPLRGESLRPGSSRGVSNVVVGPHVEVAVGAGVLLAIRQTTD